MSCKWGIQNSFFTQARYPATFPAALGSTSHAPASWPAAEGGGAGRTSCGTPWRPAAAGRLGRVCSDRYRLEPVGTGWGQLVLVGAGWYQVREETRCPRLVGHRMCQWPECHLVTPCRGGTQGPEEWSPAGYSKAFGSGNRMAGKGCVIRPGLAWRQQVRADGLLLPGTSSCVRNITWQVPKVAAIRHVIARPALWRYVVHMWWMTEVYMNSEQWVRCY